MTNHANASSVPFDRQPAPSLDELKMLRVPEAAKLCGISARHMYDLLRSGTITPTRFGRSVRVTKAALWRYIAAQDQGDR